MVEFGYVLTDENFKILGKNEFVMSPGRGGENRFYLKGRKNQKDLELSYDYDYYFEQQEFLAFYDRIRVLVENEDTICFAWSSDNDMLYLYHACIRYGKAVMKYTCYDVQKIAANFLELDKHMSLKNACIKIVGKSSTIQLQEHLSSDDAKMTMMILEAVCLLERKDSISLTNESEYAKDDAYEFAVIFNSRKKMRIEIKERHQFYKNTTKEDEILLRNSNFQGARYNFSEDLKKKVEDLDSIIAKVHSLNGVVVDSMDITDFFVVYDENNKKEMADKFMDKYNVTFMLMSELMAKEKSEIICVT